MTEAPTVPPTAANTRTVWLTLIAPDGGARALEAPTGVTLMQAARDAGVAQIVAECGGACTCATCHVHVAPAWRDRLPGPDDQEAAMLDFAADPGPGSRLSCQIRLTAELDGLTVTLPASQY